MMSETEQNIEQQPNNEEEQIVLTDQERKEAEKIIKSLIKEEKKKIFSLSAIAAIFGAGQQITGKFSAVGKGMVGANLGAGYGAINTDNLYMFAAAYLTRKTGNKTEVWLHQDYDKRPQMERKYLNPEHIQQYSDRMSDCVGCYMMQKARFFSAGVGSAVGIGLTALGLATAPISVPVMATVLGGTTVASVAQFFINRRLKDKKVQNKAAIDEDWKKSKAYSRQMYANSQMRDNTGSHEQSYNQLQEKQASTLEHSKKFIKTLVKYSMGLSAIQYAAGGLALGAAVATGLTIGPTIALTAGVLATTSAMERISSAYLGTKEYVESFAIAFNKYKKGVHDFLYGKEKLKENSNVIQLDKIKYRFRDNNPDSKTYGEYSENTAFECNDEIRFKPGITLLSGASGAGKSTLLTLMSHGDYVTDGAIRIGTTNENGNFVGQDYHDLGRLEVNQRLSVSLQSMQTDEMTVDEYIRLGNPNADEKKVQEVKALLGIGPAETSRIDEKKKIFVGGVLSGGEQPRLSLAQALIKDAPIMLLDEPTSGVDPETSQRIVDYIKKLGEQGKTVVFTTHDPEDIRRIKPYQAVDIGLHVKGQKGNDIKKFDLTTPRNLENFITFFEKRQLAEKRAKEEKLKKQVATQMDYARSMVKKRMNEGTNYVKDEKTGEETVKGIPAKDLQTYKMIKGKSKQEAEQETAALFKTIGRQIE